MIGIFDSGLGGLTLVKEFLKNYPDLDFVYLGDTARAPYGNKDQDLIKKYAKQDVEFLLTQGADLIVIACNTATSLAGGFLKEEFSNVKFVNVIDPVINEIKELDLKRLGVIGTRATINSSVYQNKIQKINKKMEVLTKACPLFVPLVEEGLVNHQVTKITVKKYLSSFKGSDLQALILGCTHYPFLQDVIQKKIGKRVKIINSPQIVLREVENGYIDKIKQNKKQKIYFTDLSTHTKQLAQEWLGIDIEPQKAEL